MRHMAMRTTVVSVLTTYPGTYCWRSAFGALADPVLSGFTDILADGHVLKAFLRKWEAAIVKLRGGDQVRPLSLI
jgi:hypothetical protein